MPLFPVIESILSPQALVKDVLPDFGIGNVTTCQFFSGGFNHTYIVKTVDGNTYYARVYRQSWRTLNDILCELDALIHLKQKRCAAAKPCARQDGSYHCVLDAPEGIRYVALFSEALGSELSYAQRPQAVAYQYGQAVARLHNALDDFTSPYRRFCIDLDHLIDEPLQHIEPFLSYRTEDWAYLKAVANVVRQRILDMPASTLEQGFCHGDLQGYHANVTEDGTMTFYDFDCGGFGYRSYDLAVFLWSSRLERQEQLRWSSFLRGYQEIRPLNTVDISAIPLFVSARYIWHMGMHTQNSSTWGRGQFNDAYFDQHLASLRAVETEYL